eukprot:TRINITY_DN9563_c0_g1_i4.p1 TRINITY_DN9563_c0_g1~~TRINITY_DN9563_c0_g1_i4.p1  ORF type:complete len:197 (+),score=43.32 TRINITY_DN9563_c0_g1_i4:178-768(+)
MWALLHDLWYPAGSASLRLLMRCAYTGCATVLAEAATEEYIAGNPIGGSAMLSACVYRMQARNYWERNQWDRSLPIHGSHATIGSGSSGTERFQSMAAMLTQRGARPHVYLRYDELLMWATEHSDWHCGFNISYSDEVSWMQGNMRWLHWGRVPLRVIRSLGGVFDVSPKRRAQKKPAAVDAYSDRKDQGPAKRLR